METSAPRIRIIDAYDLRLFKNVSMTTAYREFKLIQEHFNKQKSHVVLNREAAEYYGISVADFEALYHYNLKH